MRLFNPLSKSLSRNPISGVLCRVLCFICFLPVCTLMLWNNLRPLLEDPVRMIESWRSSPGDRVRETESGRPISSDNGTESIPSAEISKMFNLSTDDAVHVRPCNESINGAGLGNRVKRYWQVRAVCFWAFEKCQWDSISTDSFARYLPSNLSTTRDLLADYMFVLSTLHSPRDIHDF